MKRMARLLGEQCGDSLAEFTISAVVLLTAMFGIMDFSRALYIHHFASYAADEGSRYAVVHGSAFSGTSCSSTTSFSCDATSANIQSYVQSLAPPGVTASSIVVTTTWPGTLPSGSAGSCSTTASVDGCLIKVKVSIPFNFVLPFLPRNSINFVSTSEAVVEQ
jgi:Flp pilus assembly protein TadG